jgi:hypothetical protein
MGPELKIPASEDRLTVTVLGAGRLGTPLAAALRAAGHGVNGPAGRGEAPPAEAVLLCVPDAEIPAAAGATPHLLPLFDALAERTRALAGRVVAA